MMELSPIVLDILFACVAARNPDARTGTGTGTFTSTAITCPTKVCDSSLTFTAELRQVGGSVVPDEFTLAQKPVALFNISLALY